MLSYAAEFPLDTDRPSDVLECIVLWLQNSPHRVFASEELAALGSGEIAHIAAGNQTIDLLRVDDVEGQRLAAKHTAVDREVIYSTSIVARSRDGGVWVSVRTDRASLNPQISLRDAKKPQIVRVLLDKIGGGLDGELWTRDVPHALTANDKNMAIRLMNGDSSNYLPIVYVSRNFRDHLSVDAVALARQLGGMAHVVIEPSREFSRELQPYTESRNAYGGAIGVYLPTGRRSLYLPAGESEWEARNRISQVVRDCLLTRLTLPGFSWADVEAEKSRKNIEELKKAGSTDFDAFVREFDTENRALQGQIEAQKQEIDQLKNELRSAITSPDKQSSSAGTLLSIQEFFQGEAEHILKEAVENQIKSVPDDSRRLHVLSDISAKLNYSEDFERRKASAKATLSKAERLDSKTLKALEDLGFSVSSDGKHHKFTYFGDSRLTFVMAKTTSDWRAPKNLASEVTKRAY